jgi:DNA gyrase subunit A
VIRRRARHRLEADDIRKHVVDGLLIAINRIDDVIEVIRRERDRSAAKAALMSLKPQVNVSLTNSN